MDDFNMEVDLQERQIKKQQKKTGFSPNKYPIMTPSALA